MKHPVSNAIGDRPLAVTRLESGRFFVRSQRPEIEDRYLVDFTEEKFPNGHCKCIDFSVRIEHPISIGEEPERLTCIHIAAVNATLDHARALCKQAGILFSERLIPSHGEKR